MEETKATVGARLQQLMNERNLRAVDIHDLIKPLCKKYGVNISKSQLSQYINDFNEPGQRRLFILAQALEVNEAWLLGYDVPRARRTVIPEDAENIIPMPSFRTVPLVGEIACGKPILAEENVTDHISLPDYINADFCLKCKGDSMMDARIYDGDIVFIRQQDDVDDGEIAAVLIDHEATLKRVKKYPGMVVLRAANEQFEDIVLGGPGETRDIHIIGKAVFFLSNVR